MFSRLRKEAERFLARGLGVRGLLGGAFFSALTFLHTSLARERFPVWKSLPSHFFSFATFSAQEVFKLPQHNLDQTVGLSSWTLLTCTGVISRWRRKLQDSKHRWTYAINQYPPIEIASNKNSLKGLGLGLVSIGRQHQHISHPSRGES